MRRTIALSTAVVSLGLAAMSAAAPASAGPADPMRYDVQYDDFAICDVPASLTGRVFLNSRSTHSGSGSYGSTFVERTTGALVSGGDRYRYSSFSKFSELETNPAGDVRTQQLIGKVRLAGPGPLAGTVFQQRIHVVRDANGVKRVDTYVSSFCG